MDSKSLFAKALASISTTLYISESTSTESGRMMEPA